MKPIIVLIIAIGVGASSFYAGIQYQMNQLSTGRGFTPGQQGFGRNNAATVRRSGNGMTLGEILNMDSSSITVKLQDGSSRIVLLSDKTIYNKTSPVDKSDLKVGEKVNVFGTANTDGSITAQNIQLNPQFRPDRPTSGENSTGSAR